jgi:cold shock CspA family protein
MKLAELLFGIKRIRGKVKSFSDKTEFGFIEGEEVVDHFGEGGQIFLHRNVLTEDALSEALPGAEVSFSVQLNREGKPQAREVKVEVPGPGANPKEPKSKLCAEVDMAGLPPEKIYNGCIKSFTEDAGYGFITCQELHEVFGRDVFLHFSQRAGFNVGDDVAFQIYIDPKRGAPKACKLKAAAPLDSSCGAEPAKVELLAVPTPLRTEVPSFDASAIDQQSSDSSTEDSDTKNEEHLKHHLRVPLQMTADKIPEGDNAQSMDAAQSEGIANAGSEKVNAVSNCTAAPPSPPWQKFLMEDGRAWWWCSEDESCFVEAIPDPWEKFVDPVSGKCYWFKDDQHWFWEHSGSIVL